MTSNAPFFIDSLLVRMHCIIVMIRWTGLAPWELEFPFPGSLTSTFLNPKHNPQGFMTDAEIKAMEKEVTTPNEPSTRNRPSTPNKP